MVGKQLHGKSIQTINKARIKMRYKCIARRVRVSGYNAAVEINISLTAVTV
jgi:hypothetical protein